MTFLGGSLEVPLRGTCIKNPECTFLCRNKKNIHTFLVEKKKNTYPELGSGNCKAFYNEKHKA